MSDIGLPVKTDYKADSIDLLYQLIEYSNPGFTAEFPKGTLRFSVPVNVAVIPGDVYKTDTLVNVSSAPGAGKIGNKDIRYRRINLVTMFKSMVVQITDYRPSSTLLGGEEWKTSLRARYGINIPSSDFAQQSSINVGNTTISIVAGSLCYKGSFVLNWTKSSRPLSDVITNANRALAGRLYPGGNDFTTPGIKPQGEFMVFCIDATAEMLKWPTLLTSGTWSATSIAVSLASFLNANTARTNWVSDQHTVEGGLAGLTFFKYTLSPTTGNVSIPEANFAKYNRCLVFPALSTSWFKGKIIIHWNE